MEYVRELEQMMRASRVNTVYMAVYFVLAVVSLLAWFGVAASEAPLPTQILGYAVMLYCCIRCTYHCYRPQRLLRKHRARMQAQREREGLSPVGSGQE